MRTSSAILDGMATDDTTAAGGFRRFWATNTLSAFGTTLTAVALPVLVVDVLHADPLEVGFVNAAQFVPYAVLGLLAGVYVDRWRRKKTLVVASIGRALSLAAIALLWALDVLAVWNLIALLLLFGSFSVFGFAASQSLLPNVVPRSALLRANAQLDQGEAAAQTVGPTLSGLIVRWVGAPLALVIDAATYVVDAILISTLRIAEQPKKRKGHILADMREGISATYRHRVLGPLAISTHVWFVANAAGLTILSLFALRTLDLGAALFGVLLSVAGAATLLGASLAERCGKRWGEGRTITMSRVLYPLGWVLVALVSTVGGSTGTVILFVAMAITGFAGGLENANEMSYRQQAVPDGLLGRVNATGRSFNRTAGAIGAILGGSLVAMIGEQPAIWAVVAGFALSAFIAILSPVRSAHA